MTEKELIKTQIEELQKKLKDIEEQESRKSPCEEAFKKVYGKYPSPNITDTCCDGSTWIDFSNGYPFAYEERIQEDYQPSMTNCTLEGTPPDGYVTWHEWFNEMGSKGILHKLRISSIEHKNQEELKKLYEDCRKEVVVKELEEKYWTCKVSSDRLKTLYELLDEKTAYGCINMEDAFEIAKGWLIDNTEVVSEDHYTDTLKLNKGTFGGSND